MHARNAHTLRNVRRIKFRPEHMRVVQIIPSYDKIVSLRVNASLSRLKYRWINCAPRRTPLGLCERVIQQVAINHSFADLSITIPNLDSKSRLRQRLNVDVIIRNEGWSK